MKGRRKKNGRKNILETKKHERSWSGIIIKKKKLLILKLSIAFLTLKLENLFYG